MFINVHIRVFKVVAMLYKYKNNYEKIVMGYLSYFDEFKILKNLLAEIKLYNESDIYTVYLYRSNPTVDFQGVVCVQVEAEFVVIRYVSINPSYDREKIIEMIMKELHELYQNKLLCMMPDYAYLMKYIEESDT